MTIINTASRKWGKSAYRVDHLSGTPNLSLSFLYFTLLSIRFDCNFGACYPQWMVKVMSAISVDGKFGWLIISTDHNIVTQIDSKFCYSEFRKLFAKSCIRYVATILGSNQRMKMYSRKACQNSSSGTFYPLFIFNPKFMKNLILDKEIPELHLNFSIQMKSFQTHR